MDKNLTKNIEIIGEWFLPNSEEKIPGVFRYEDGQSRLELLRPFILTSTSNSPLEIIYGHTQRGLVTLTDVIFGVTLTHGSVYSAIFGNHLDNNHKLTGITFDFDLLNEWAISKHPHQIVQDNFLANTLEKYTFTINDVTCELLISLGSSVGYLKGSKTYNMSNFLLKTKKSMSFYDLFDYVLGIQYFLMLVMGRNVNLDSMSTLSETTHRSDIFLPVDRKDSTGSDLDHFFNIHFIEKNYTEILTNWFNFYQKNKYLLKMFFETMDKNTVESTDFFIYASLLEGFYKYKYTGESEYKKRIHTVLQLFATNFSNLDDFIEQIHKMRNDNFHFNKPDNLDEELLSKITHDLFFLIRIIFLNHIDADLKINKIPYLKDFLFLKQIK